MMDESKIRERIAELEKRKEQLMQNEQELVEQLICVTAGIMELQRLLGEEPE